MDARLGWALAVVGVALGWVQWGWQGVLLALSVIVFWLLLQFTRALRAPAAPELSVLREFVGRVQLSEEP